MRIVLRQAFPLGRFHATPWRVNPYDDPHGEWPPSPWRLVRAVTARWYQWAREKGSDPERPEHLAELERLQGALCHSTYSFHLPPSARRGSPLRQYHPTTFGWNPAGGKLPGIRSYGTSLVQDNCWCVPPDEPVWWFLDGDAWTEDLVAALKACVERLTWFGRAETLTCVVVSRMGRDVPVPNCTLHDQRTAGAVPVLVPLPDATRADIERTTDDGKARQRSVPPGAGWRFADRPPRPPVREPRRSPAHQESICLVQLAIGWNVAPEVRAVARLTSRFRGAVLRELLRLKTGDPKATWSRASRDVRRSVAPMVGKDCDGTPLSGHRHAEFFAWCESDDAPTRLLVWRGAAGFDADEQEAIIRAAHRDVSWAAPGMDTDEWKVRLIPLDSSVAPPPGFDRGASLAWESVTPYVPPRHHLRGGKERERETLDAQIRRELRQRGLPEAVACDPIGPPSWVPVHVPRRDAGQRHFIGSRLGHRVRLAFPHPIAGPLRLGHSSSFGLGLFRPLDWQESRLGAVPAGETVDPRDAAGAAAHRR